MHHPHVFFFHDAEFFFFQMDHMGGEDFPVQHTEILQIRKHPFAGGGQAFFLFPLGFRDMDMKGNIPSPRFRRRFFQKPVGAGIHRVGRQSEREPPLQIIFAVIDHPQRVAQSGLTAVIDDTFAENAADTAFLHGPDRRRFVKIHIGVAGNAGFQHFHLGKQNAPKDIFAVQTRFRGLHQTEPVPQGKIFTVASEHTHGGVAVPVDKTGQSDLILAVNDLIAPFGGKITQSRNALSVNADGASLQLRTAGHRQIQNILNKQRHIHTPGRSVSPRENERPSFIAYSSNCLRIPAAKSPVITPFSVISAVISSWGVTSKAGFSTGTVFGAV